MKTGYREYLSHANAGGRRWLACLIVAFALVNGVLYALLTPLWEGFDEAFHYGYVQDLSVRHRIPALGRSSLSVEVWDSLRLAPVSHVVKNNIPALMTFQEYFGLPEGERRRMRNELEAIAPAESRALDASHPNYEAHQAPLAYLVLAVPDKLLSDFPIVSRVRVLRILSVALSILLTAGAAMALCRQLGVPAPFRELVLFLAFSSQMFYATSAHISNDWLAPPLLSWWLVSAVRAWRKPGLRTTACSALLLACGLLTKAYFLAMLPLFVGVGAVMVLRKRVTPAVAAGGMVMVGLIAGPWYVRNLLVNKSFSGMQEEAAGIGFTKVADAAAGVPWAASIPYMARASLWTGNNQFTTFSRRTLDLLLFLLGAGTCYYLAGIRKYGLSPGDAIVLSAIGLFVLAVAYVTVVAYVNTNGASAGASPWYMQALLVPVLTVVMSGLARGGRFARFLAGVQAVLWMYVILATYVVKLIPQYGGYSPALTHAGDIAKWYRSSAPQRNEILSTTALCPPAVLYGLVLTVCACGALLTVIVCRLLPARQDTR